MVSLFCADESWFKNRSVKVISTSLLIFGIRYILGGKNNERKLEHHTYPFISDAGRLQAIPVIVKTLPVPPLLLAHGTHHFQQ
jgi:hypothetical protein